MKITAIKTNKIKANSNLYQILDRYLKKPKENSILAVTSKIVSLCEGNVIPISEKIDKKELVYEEADYYLPKEKNKYGIILTLKNGLLVPTAGIDESNCDGNYVLWPNDPQKSANQIRKYLRIKYNLRHFGVIITDSKTSPLRWGTTGIGIAYSGFSPLNNYIGKGDIYGRKMKITRANILDGLAVASVLVMGEGSEQTPMAMIDDLYNVKFCDKNPSQKEIENLSISPEDDLYGDLITSVRWKPRKRRR